MKKKIILKKARRAARASVKAKNAKDNYGKSICFFRKTNQHFYVSFLYGNGVPYLSVDTVSGKKSNTDVRKSTLVPQLAKDFYDKILQHYPNMLLKNIYFNKRNYAYQGNIQIFCEALTSYFNQSI